MSAMLEELAKAICADDLGGDKWWARCDKGRRDQYRNTARAVLTRLREPTPGMVHRSAAYFTGSQEQAEQYAERSFTAMIDAALEGK